MKPLLRFAATGLLLAFSAATFAQEAAPAVDAEAAASASEAEAVDGQPLPAAAAPVAEPTPAEAPLDRSTLSYSNKWRVKFDNEAKSDGTLVFRLVMKDTKVEPITVSIPIKDGTNENNSAGKVKSALKKAFPRDFNVETDDGESVLVKLNVIEGSSSLVLLSNDVKNLKIKIKKE
ncbi:MAG TPA: hypothetical protein VN248_01945 [Arenimonas sp.]|nr:hypothetical protein [Arenimonas sp.]